MTEAASVEEIRQNFLLSFLLGQTQGHELRDLIAGCFPIALLFAREIPRTRIQS